MYRSDADVNVITVRILPSGDERAKWEDFRLSKDSELEGLNKRRIGKVVKEGDIPDDANVLGGAINHEAKELRYAGRERKGTIGWAGIQ